MFDLDGLVPHETSTQLTVDTSRPHPGMAPKWIWLAGFLGCMGASVYADTTPVASATMKPTGLWTPTTFKAFARTAADRTGCPLIDTTPAESWETWEQDAWFRVQVVWDRQVATDRTEFPSLYAQQTDEPPQMKRTLHAYTVDSGLHAPPVTVTKTTLEFGAGQQIELSRIFDVHLRAESVRGEAAAISIEILTDTNIVQVIPPQGGAPESVLHILQWLAEDLRSQAHEARGRPHREASPTTVPDALRQMLDKG